MTGEGFRQVAISVVGQGSNSHLDAVHTQEGHPVAACEKHWQHKQMRDHAKLKRTLENTEENISIVLSILHEI